MLFNVAPFIMIIVTTWLIVMLLNNLMKYRIKRRIVETNMNDESLIGAILESEIDKEERKMTILKWVFLGFFLGVGLIILEFIPYKMDESLLPYGVLSIFLSVGLLLYYFTIQYLFKKQEER